MPQLMRADTKPRHREGQRGDLMQQHITLYQDCVVPSEVGCAVRTRSLTSERRTRARLNTKQPIFLYLSNIERAFHTAPTAIEHVSVDHRGRYIRVSQYFLYGSDVVTGFQ